MTGIQTPQARAPNAARAAGRRAVDANAAILSASLVANERRQPYDRAAAAQRKSLGAAHFQAPAVYSCAGCSALTISRVHAAVQNNPAQQSCPEERTWNAAGKPDSGPAVVQQDTPSQDQSSCCGCSGMAVRDCRRVPRRCTTLWRRRASCWSSWRPSEGVWRMWCGCPCHMGALFFIPVTISWVSNVLPTD